MSDQEPVDAVRSRPGEFFLAAEHVEQGMRFRVQGGVVYEVVSEPKQWGAAVVAQVKVVEGLKPGTVLRGMLHVGRKVDP